MNRKIADLELIPGTYLYTGNGDTITVNISAAVAAVPEPATWGMMILGFGLAGVALRSATRVRGSVARFA